MSIDKFGRKLAGETLEVVKRIGDSNILLDYDGHYILKNRRIKLLGAPEEGMDAVTKDYVDARISVLDHSLKSLSEIVSINRELCGCNNKKPGKDVRAKKG